MYRCQTDQHSYERERLRFWLGILRVGGPSACLTEIAIMDEDFHMHTREIKNRLRFWISSVRQKVRIEVSIFTNGSWKSVNAKLTIETKNRSRLWLGILREGGPSEYKTEISIPCETFHKQQIDNVVTNTARKLALRPDTSPKYGLIFHSHVVVGLFEINVLCPILCLTPCSSTHWTCLLKMSYYVHNFSHG